MRAIAATISVMDSMIVNISEQLPNVRVFQFGVPDVRVGRIIHRNTAYSFRENKMFTANWNSAMHYLLDEDNGVEYVWMLNDDLQGIRPYMMEKLVQAMDSMPKAACITPAFNSPHEIFGKHHAPNEDFGARPTPWMDWCCPLVRVSAWKEVGEFDEQFVGYGADIDWCRRARDFNYTFHVLDTIEVTHMGSVTTEELGANAQRDLGTMDSLIRAKWHVNSFWDLMR